jgi:hypothetical protein
MQMPLSGASWASTFPTSNSLSSLDASFRTNVTAFLDALTAAGAQIQITATRPAAATRLSHALFLVHLEALARDGPHRSPPLVLQGAELPVDIQWRHTSPTGAPGLSASVSAALAMVNAYGIAGLHVPPALNSNHIQGKALDMVISWQGTLSIKDKTGVTKLIASAPRNGTNADLIQVGKTYGVHHLHNVMADPPHWSYNGF